MSKQELMAWATVPMHAFGSFSIDDQFIVLLLIVTL